MPQSHEKQYIDPFESVLTVSTEGFAFPIEEFLPNDENPVMPKDEPSSNAPIEQIVYELENDDSANGIVIKEGESTTVDSDAGELNVSDENSPLEVNPANHESDSDDITDTPQDPAEPPEGVETRISLEEDLDQVASLEQVALQIRTLGGVCKNDILQLESIVPGVITNQHPINRFSSIPTKVGMDISLEGIGKAIADGVLRILEKIWNGLKRLLGYGNSVRDSMKDKTNNAEFANSLKKRYSELLDRAKAIDSVNKDNRKFQTDFPEFADCKTFYDFARARSVFLFNKSLSDSNQLVKMVITNKLDEEATTVIKVANNHLQNILKAVASVKSDSNNIHIQDIDDLEALLVENQTALDKLQKTGVPVKIDNIEKLWAINDPSATIDAFIKDATNTILTTQKTIEQLQAALEKDKSINKDALAILTTVAKEILVVESLEKRLKAIKGAVTKTYTALDRVLDLITRNITSYRDSRLI